MRSNYPLSTPIAGMVEYGESEEFFKIFEKASSGDMSGTESLDASGIIIIGADGASGGNLAATGLSMRLSSMNLSNHAASIRLSSMNLNAN